MESFSFGCALISHRSHLSFSSESEVSCPLSGIDEIPDGSFLHFRVCYLVHLFLDDLLTKHSCFCAGIVHEIFLQRDQGIGMTAVDDLSAFQKHHEAVSRSPFSVAGSAETG